LSATRRADVSVAIATRDRPQALARCLESLRAGHVLPAEIVVADQGAGPDARAVASAADRPELPVRWVDGGSAGLAGGQNAAFRQAAMPLVAVLDDDCVADPGWIEALERAFAADPALALVGGRVLPLPAVGNRVFPVASRTSTERRELRSRSAPWNVGSGNNFALRRDWFDRVGGGDERLGPGTAGQGALDIDLFYRVLRAGGRALYEPGAVVRHEPATRRGRLERRWPYGHGMGAACAIRLREGDLYAIRLLGGWVALRLRVLASALLSRRWAALREEALVLGGTVAGIAHGLRDGLRLRRRREAR
jgi:GT2 family glycosyltransferase